MCCFWCPASQFRLDRSDVFTGRTIMVLLVWWGHKREGGGKPGFNYTRIIRLHNELCYISREWREEGGRRKKDEDTVSGRRSVSPILVQTCCDELSREPPSSCQQAKAASMAQSQAAFFYFLLKYFCLKAVIGEKTLSLAWISHWGGSRKSCICEYAQFF